MPARESEFARRVKLRYPDFAYQLWTDANLPPMTDAVRHHFDWRGSEGNYAFQADVLRVQVLASFGGVYLDVDCEPRKLCPWISRVPWFHHHGDADPTITNDAFALPLGHPLGAFLLQRINRDDYAYGPHWLGYALRAWCDLSANATQPELSLALFQRGVHSYRSGRNHSPHLQETDSWEDYFYHHALYSWSPENKERFAKGLIK